MLDTDLNVFYGEMIWKFKDEYILCWNISTPSIKHGCVECFDHLTAITYWSYPPCPISNGSTYLMYTGLNYQVVWWSDLFIFKLTFFCETCTTNNLWTIHLLTVHLSVVDMGFRLKQILKKENWIFSLNFYRICCKFFEIYNNQYVKKNLHFISMPKESTRAWWLNYIQT